MNRLFICLAIFFGSHAIGEEQQIPVAVAKQGDRLHVIFVTKPWLRYVVEYSVDLTVWTRIDIVISDPKPMVFTAKFVIDPESSGLFFRVIKL